MRNQDYFIFLSLVTMCSIFLFSWLAMEMRPKVKKIERKQIIIKGKYGAGICGGDYYILRDKTTGVEYLVVQGDKIFKRVYRKGKS